MSDGDLKIQYVPLSEVQRWPRNPKDHDIGQLSQSIQRFGYVNPVLIDERTGKLVAGHGRVDTLQAMKAQGETPPRRVKAENGEWYVPVIRGVGFNSDAEAEAYLLADNRLTEIGGWEDQRLAETLSDLTAEGEAMLTGIGFDGDDIDQLLADLEPEQEVVEDEHDGTPPEEAESECGEVYELGPHRLMCGDATDEDDVAALLDGAEPRLMVTDPPYGVDYDPEWRNEAAEAGHLSYAPTRTGEVSGDESADWTPAWGLSPAAVAYVWHAGIQAATVQLSLEDSRFDLRAQIIWNKPHFPISRGHYHWRHEPCWYAVRGGETAEWKGDRKQTTVWGVTLDENVEGGHGTQKPVELFARPLRNHKGDVYDPFCGSGTAIIAAEQLGRTCYAMEIDPAYCDVIRQRYADFTDQPELAP